jgi:predicted nucleotidyltransferase
MKAKLNLSEAEKQALDKFKILVLKKFAGEVLELRLFGSRSRGEGNEYSDLDVAVMVKQESSNLRRHIYDLAATIFQEDDINISPLILSLKKFNWLKAIERRIALEIEKQGIKL